MSCSFVTPDDVLLVTENISPSDIYIPFEQTVGWGSRIIDSIDATTYHEDTHDYLVCFTMSLNRYNTCLFGEYIKNGGPWSKVYQNSKLLLQKCADKIKIMESQITLPTQKIYEYRSCEEFFSKVLLYKRIEISKSKTLKLMQEINMI